MSGQGLKILALCPMSLVNQQYGRGVNKNVRRKTYGVVRSLFILTGTTCCTVCMET